jgi:hypothetical protein
VELSIKKLERDLRSELIHINKRYLSRKMLAATTITVEDGGRPLPRADETEKVSEKVPEEDIHARALTDSLNRNERNLVDLSFSSTDETFRAELREVLLRESVASRHPPSGFIWDDKFLSPGDDYVRTFEEHVAQTRIMVMLVSPRYLEVPDLQVLLNCACQ